MSVSLRMLSNHFTHRFSKGWDKNAITFSPSPTSRDATANSTIDKTHTRYRVQRVRRPVVGYVLSSAQTAFKASFKPS